jgi:endonuclease/exonuclease/phosphatase family metal-dependent hydrolase
MKKGLYYFFVGVTCLLCIGYLLACLTPVISPVDVWPMAFLALGFPYLAAALFLFIPLWFFVKKKAALILLLVFACGYTNLSSTWAINLKSNSPVKAEKTLRILGWNVRNFDNPAFHADSANSVRNRMFRYISQVNPDVLCLQEMVEYVGPSFLSNIHKLRAMGYVYYYKPEEVDMHFPYGTLQSSNAIFSKYPIVDSGVQLLNDSSHPKKIIYADISFEGRKLRVFSTHYRSFYLGALPPDPPMSFHFDTSFIHKASNFEKLKVISLEHVKEAAIVRKLMDGSPHPVVLACDMNSVPASFTYHYTKHQLQDAFLERGFGLGGSVDSLPKTLRIDYLFADKQLQIVNYRRKKLSLSDHYPHFMDVMWRQ